jgi:hypothetical protein
MPASLREEERERSRQRQNIFTGKKTSKGLYRTFIILEVISVAVLIVSWLYGFYLEVASTLPVLFCTAVALAINRETVRFPPLTVYLTFGFMVYIVTVIYFKDHPYSMFITDLTVGTVIGISGLITAYVSLNSKPGIGNDRPIFSLLLSYMCSLSLFSMLMMTEYLLISLVNMVEGYSCPMVLDYEGVIEELIITFVTSAIICFLFYIGPDSLLFRFIIMEYDSNNLGIASPGDVAAREIDNLINLGECDTVEFKSTLSTNIKNNEHDPRLEMAVLKTIVAFMNTDGGNLLIGVNDEGHIIGIDEEGFPNRDGMILHLTELVTKHIGREFIQFVSIRIMDVNDDGVLRVTCAKSNRPVFLREGREDKFYARIGPSSVCLSGKEMLNYSRDHFRFFKLKKTI